MTGLTDRAKIETALSRHGLVPDRWDPESENGLTARFDNDWIVVEEDADRGLYDDDKGKLSACLVGSVELGNERVLVTFTSTGTDEDSGPEVMPFDDVEPIS